MKIITVSREFGSGGREIAKRLSDELGIAYYDREILTAISEKCLLDEKYVEEILNKKLIANYPISFSHTFSYAPMLESSITNILSQQHKIIRELAEKEDCIIVGRCADVILEEHNPFKIFVYADMDAKVERCLSRAEDDENFTRREMEKKIKQIDKARASYHNVIADYPWGDKRGYNLCVNTTRLNIKGIVPYISNYITEYFAEQK